jgi:hypothetical protein
MMPVAYLHELENSATAKDHEPAPGRHGAHADTLPYSAGIQEEERFAYQVLESPAEMDQPGILRGQFIADRRGVRGTNQVQGVF